MDRHRLSSAEDASRAKMAGDVGTVNPPMVRCSTVFYRDIGTRKAVRVGRERGGQFAHDASGTPATLALEDASNALAGLQRTLLIPSGRAAIARAYLSIRKPGAHRLCGETVYGRARAIAIIYLVQQNISCEFHHRGHEQVAKRLGPETQLVYLDNAGSSVHDIEDVVALAKLLAARETLLAAANTWRAPGFYRPLELGADISIVGHLDLVEGAVSATSRGADRLWRDAHLWGQTVRPDDAYSARKGARTAAARLAMHQGHARQPQVAHIPYPALVGDPSRLGRRGTCVPRHWMRRPRRSHYGPRLWLCRMRTRLAARRVNGLVPTRRGR